MDAATRTELARLRRRAYGPSPDIDGDPDAVARLIELEDLVLSDHARSAGQVSPPGDDLPAQPSHSEHLVRASSARPSAADAPTPGTRQPESQVAEPAEPDAPRGGRPRAIAAVAGGLAVVAGAGVWLAGLAGAEPAAPPRAEQSPTASIPSIEGREAYSFARDSGAVELLHVPLDGPFGNYIDLPSDAYVPSFPTSGVVDWASPLGEYYGWSLWIAGAAGVVQREHCLLIESGGVQHGRCVPAVLRANAALLVSVPYTMVTPAERPIALDPNERLGFWWHDDGAVTILVGDDPPR
ncbi:hypothetical protein [Microbacterium sulfonylureivorans]|uniref:hypothetical protein n=1 Tax=Microbacterium sulfonylureivorans TaxID=2486854 RepID=UPI00197C493F|nr:hypothetical protein [Microbacterium sulfonylureivorans]